MDNRLITYIPYVCSFIHIPKTGGNSISSWMQSAGASVEKGYHLMVSESQLSNAIMGFKFCVVRNPWDWVASWYDFEIQIHKESLLETSGDLYEKRLTRLNELHEMEFTGFVRELSRGEWKIGYKKPQYMWAKDCDLVLRYENLEKQFQIIQNRLNCWMELPRKNVTKNRPDYKSRYTQETIDLVYKQYRIDCEKYGYSY